MAEYWVGPSLRQPRPPWIRTGTPSTKGHPTRREYHAALPLAVRRWRGYLRLARLKLHDVVFLARYVAHALVLILTFTIGRVYGLDIATYLPQPQSNTPYAEAEDVAPLLWADVPEDKAIYLSWDSLPRTVVAERSAIARYEPIPYEVREGDNPSIIAARFGLQPSTIVWSNTEVEDNPDLLSIGQILLIPPVDGVLHTVEEGDTITAIAEAYEVEPPAIVEYPGNHLKDASQPLVLGQHIIVPDGRRPYVPPPPPPPAPVTAASSAPAAPSTNTSSGTTSSTTTSSSSTSTSSSSSSSSSNNGWSYEGPSGCCRWPVSGRITTQPSNWHMALDIANRLGTPVGAADGGRVVATGWDNTGYGWRVMIDHGNGVRTLYAHLSYYYVDYGDYINKGDIIGKVGSSGNSTGPHLHFEVRLNGWRVNPYNWLP